MVHDYSKLTHGKKGIDPMVERVSRMSRARVHFNHVSLNQDQEADKRIKRQLRHKTIESDWAKPVRSCEAQDNQFTQMLKARMKYNDLSKERLKKAEERQIHKLERLSLNRKLENIQSELHNLRNVNDHLLKTFGVGHQLAKLIRDQDEEYEKLKKKCEQIAEVRIYERQKQAALAKRVQDLERQTEKIIHSEQDHSNLKKIKDVRDKYSHIKLINRSSQCSAVGNQPPRKQSSCNYSNASSEASGRENETAENTMLNQISFVKNKSVAKNADSIIGRQPVSTLLGIRKSSAPNELQRTIALKAVQKMNLVQIPISISTNRVRLPESGTNLSRIGVQNENFKAPNKLCERSSTIKKSVTLPKESFESSKENDALTREDLKCNICHQDLHDLSRLTLDTTCHSHANASMFEFNKEQENMNSTHLPNYTADKRKCPSHDEHNSASSDGITFEEVSSSSLSLSLSPDDINSAWFKDRPQSLSDSSCETLNSDDITIEITNKSFFNSTENKIISDAADITHRLRAMLKDVDERCCDITGNSNEREMSIR